MANTITAIVPKLLGSMLDQLRANSIMPRLVNRSYDSLAAQKGDTINVPVPPTIATSAVTPAITTPAAVDTTFTTVGVSLDQWYEAPFHMTDKDMMEAMEGATPRAAQAALAALIDRIDTYILTQMSLGASRAVGTAGTTPFATTALALGPNKELSENRVPREGRHAVFDANAELNLLSLDSFSRMDFVGDVTAMTDGSYNGNRRAGMQWWLDQNIPTVTASSTLGGSPVTNGALSVGATSIAVDGGTGNVTIAAGDVITFTGFTDYKYVVKSVTGDASSGTITIGSPGLREAIPNGTAYTLAANHVANVAFQRDCFVFASRPFMASNAAIASQTLADPVSGLSLRLEVVREHKQDRWSLDALYGGAVVRPDGVIKVLG